MGTIQVLPAVCSVVVGSIGTKRQHVGQLCTVAATVRQRLEETETPPPLPGQAHVLNLHARMMKQTDDDIWTTDRLPGSVAWASRYEVNRVVGTFHVNSVKPKQSICTMEQVISCFCVRTRNTLANTWQHASAIT